MRHHPGVMEPRTILQRSRILAKLASGPMSAQELADTIHLTRTAILLHVQVLREEKQVRIAGHRMQYRSREIPLYGLGSEPDAQYIKAKYRQPNAFEVQRAKVRAAILLQLQKARATAPELAILTNLAGPTVRKYLPKMHAERLIHRAAWVEKEGGGNQVAVWAAGDKPDAPMDKVLKKRIQTPLSEEQRAIMKCRREVGSTVRSARKKPQGIFAALGV